MSVYPFEESNIKQEAESRIVLEQALESQLHDILPVVQRRILMETTWVGEKALKNPLDFWVYQEIIFAQRPDVIIEIGNRFGGSTLALAHLCDVLGYGRVIGVDITHADVGQRVREHPRITLITGDACEKATEVKALIADSERVLVIEDSSHTFENTLNVLRIYGDLISIGGYFIVEDSICHRGLEVGPSPGPYEAIERFVEDNSGFVVDRSHESFLITWNPKGFLRRVS